MSKRKQVQSSLNTFFGWKQDRESNTTPTTPAAAPITKTWKLFSSSTAKNHCFISNWTNPINKTFLRLIYLKNSTFHTYWCQEWNIKTSLLTASFINMRTLTFKAQPTNTFFTTVNQVFGDSSQLPTDCRACRNQIVEHSSDNETVLGSSRKLGLAAEHLIDGSEKPILSVELWILEFACYWKAQ